MKIESFGAFGYALPPKNPFPSLPYANNLELVNTIHCCELSSLEYILYGFQCDNCGHTYGLSR